MTNLKRLKVIQNAMMFFQKTRFVLFGYLEVFWLESDNYVSLNMLKTSDIYVKDFKVGSAFGQISPEKD